MKKQFVSLLLAFVFILGLPACSGGNKPQNDVVSETASTPTATAIPSDLPNDTSKQYDSWESCLKDIFSDEFTYEEPAAESYRVIEIRFDEIEDLSEFMLDAFLASCAVGITYKSYGLDPVDGLFMFAQGQDHFGITAVKVDSLLGVMTLLNIGDDCENKDEIQAAYDEMFSLTDGG